MERPSISISHPKKYALLRNRDTRFLIAVFLIAGEEGVWPQFYLCRVPPLAWVCQPRVPPLGWVPVPLGVVPVGFGGGW